MGQNRDLISAVARLSRMLRRHPVEKDALSRMSVHVLRVVQENDGIRATELAELAEVRPASMTETLNRLEREGYVTRERDAADFRAKRVFVTEKARAQYQERTRGHQEENDRLLACLTEEEAETFLSVCGKLCAVLEREHPDSHRREDRHRKQEHHHKEEAHE